jgi:hypothetical protein
VIVLDVGGGEFDTRIELHGDAVGAGMIDVDVGFGEFDTRIELRGDAVICWAEEVAEGCRATDVDPGEPESADRI